MPTSSSGSATTSPAPASSSPRAIARAPLFAGELRVALLEEGGDALEEVLRAEQLHLPAHLVLQRRVEIGRLRRVDGALDPRLHQRRTGGEPLGELPRLLLRLGRRD